MLEALRNRSGYGGNRESVIHHSLGGFFAIRKGDWKFCPNLGSGGFTEPRAREPLPGEPAGTLFNIRIDPEEKYNQYTSHPEIVKELSALLEKNIKQGYTRKDFEGMVAKK